MTSPTNETPTAPRDDAALVPETTAPNDTLTTRLPAVHIEWIGGMCPVQANGTIDGVPFYFRARHDAWSIEIGPGNTHECVETAGAEGLPCWSYEESYGADGGYDAGYMDLAEARVFIAQGAWRWRKQNPTEPSDAPAADAAGRA